MPSSIPIKSLSFSFDGENRQDAENEIKWGNYTETHVHADSHFNVFLSRLSQEREPCFRDTAGIMRIAFNQ